MFYLMEKSTFKKYDFTFVGFFFIFKSVFLSFLFPTLQLPSLIKNGSTNTRTFIYHNIGILFGALVIILLSIFESRIEILH